MTWDVAIVGLGAMGSATAYDLAQRGVRVIGFDRFEPPHERGSSHGESRIIRTAYFEHPSYVPLLKDAFASWRRLEAATGEQVLRMTGILEAGPPNGELVLASLRSAIEHGLPHEILSPPEVAARFPAFRLPADWRCVVQPDAGILFPEKAIRLFLSMAQRRGAALRTHTTVREIRPVADHVALYLVSGEIIEAGAAVVCAGPWVTALLPELLGKVTLTRQPLLWFRPRIPGQVTPDCMPLFFLETETDQIYGFPEVSGTGVKVASHLSGGTLASAEAPRAEASGDEQSRLLAALERYIPAAAGPMIRTTTCLYTRAPDGHFILGLHPTYPQIVIASPCSGHGFKFASVFGEILAELAMTQRTAEPIELFRPDRFILNH
jgi:sarcosine oxidase